MKTQVMAFVMLIVALLAVVPGALAQDFDNSNDYDITSLRVNDLSYTNTVYAERGDEVSVDVYLEGTGDTQDVRIRVWLGGYEYDDVTATSEMFDIEDGVSYKKTVNLALPEDLNAEQDYTLYVEVFDDENFVEYQSALRVSKVYHLLDIVDINVDNAENGDYVSVEVLVENMGDHKEENVEVTVSVEDLGITTSTYLAEVTNDEIDNEDEESSNSITLTFQVPADALTGDYEMKVVLDYNRGHDTVEETTVFHVDGLEIVVDETTEDDSTVTIVVTDDETTEEEEDSNDFTTALRLGFGILAVLIIILALILIVRR
jgi:hypothetical protein